jgi:cytochrome b561
MQDKGSQFAQRWSIWLSGASVFTLIVGAVLAIWIQSGQSGIGSLEKEARDSLLRQYNDIAHAGLIIILILLAGILIRAINNAPEEEASTTNQSGWLARIIHFIRRHPAVTIVLSAYTVVMVSESSWFYKEILTWYDDIYTDQLLNNFSLRHSFIRETMGRNDFRFYPLSHQDLHILSWFTPYIKVWSLVSALELITTIILGCKIVQFANKDKASPSLFLAGSLLFLFTSAAAFNYFQFIYSERILTFLLALYIYHYSIYQHSGQQRNGLLALLFALFIPFFKDTAILLAVVPAASTILLGSLGRMQNYPRWGSLNLSAWLKAYALEISLCSLTLFFMACFVMLSALPSLVAGVERYDAHLGFSVFALDIRLMFFIGFIATRLWLIQRNRTEATTLDVLNVAALTYAFALYALVGLEGSNYMTLPIQFVAVLDILLIWEALAAPKLNQRLNQRQAQAIALGATLLVLTVEDRQAKTFRERASFISWKQRSWRKTYNRAEKIAQEAREQGEDVNLIYSKGWFKHSDQMKQLPYDRLVFYDIESKQYKIKDGINKGMAYTPTKGDFLIDIDTGYKLTKFGIDLSKYEVLYQENKDFEYARIFRHL